jgi:hypothetical protein
MIMRMTIPEIVLMCLIVAGCHAPKEKAPTSVMDRSSPEKSLHTFWSAVNTGNSNAALACTNPERVAAVIRHGRDVRRYIDENRATDPSTFRFIASSNRCSVESPTHCMDYDMEKNDKGEWIIVSIHP